MLQRGVLSLISSGRRRCEPARRCLCIAAKSFKGMPKARVRPSSDIGMTDLRDRRERHSLPVRSYNSGRSDNCVDGDERRRERYSNEESHRYYDDGRRGDQSGHDRNPIRKNRSRSPRNTYSRNRRDSSKDHRYYRQDSEDEADYRQAKRRRKYSYSSSPPPRPDRPYRSSRNSPRLKCEPSYSTSPPPRRSRQSPPISSRNTKHSLSPPDPPKRSYVPLPSQNEAYKGTPSSDLTVVKPPPIAEKQKPNFAPSGKLAAETNTVAGTSIILKYNEPPESRKPPLSQPWRLYVFKGSQTLETIELSTRSCWLFGRERSVVDFPIDHPSCSKQHAVLQFRFVEKKNEFGDREGGVRPYVIDLESANGTKVNGEALPERRYVEVRGGDVLAFGDSTREYVLMLPPAG